MKILAIETSCDETGIAVLKTSGKKMPDFELLSNVVASQVKVHQKYGGVYPAMAKREHQKNLVPVLKKALLGAKLLKKSKCQMSNVKCQKLEAILTREEILCKRLKKFLSKYQEPDIDVIAVTVGPGLEPCLWVGVNFAKALAFWWNLPVIPVNHIEAHITVNWLTPRLGVERPTFPALALVVSGGHTQLILMKDFDQYKIIGETRDDAAGECFDKTARVLGLPYPGGPAIAAEAAKLQTTNYKLQTNLPRPMMYSKDYDFSFSGLKTAVLYDFKKRNGRTKKSKKYVQQMAAEIQDAINDVLIKKTIKAAKDFRVKTIILGGGVAANKQLRERLEQKIRQELPNTSYLKPNISFCVDNAAMIAVTAFYHLDEKWDWQDIKVNANLRVE